MNRLLGLQERWHRVGRVVAIVGGVVLAASAFLPWAYAFSALDGMTLVGNPSPLQICGLVLGCLLYTSPSPRDRS